MRTVAVVVVHMIEGWEGRRYKMRYNYPSLVKIPRQTIRDLYKSDNLKLSTQRNICQNPNKTENMNTKTDDTTTI